MEVWRYFSRRARVENVGGRDFVVLLHCDAQLKCKV